MQTLRRPTPGHWQATTHGISKTPARQEIGNSPKLPAVTHPHRFAPADLRFDLVEKFHARTIGREIALDLGIPLAAISVGKPAQEGYLLLTGKRLNSVLDLPEVHIRIVPLGALKKTNHAAIARSLDRARAVALGAAVSVNSITELRSIQ